MSWTIIGNNRVTISNSISKDEIKEISEINELRCIQISEYIDNSSIEILNENLLKKRNDVQFRIFGFYNHDKCDLTFLELLTNVSDLSIDGLVDVENISVLEKLERLKRLRVYVNKITNFDFINMVTTNIIDLSIGTESKKNNMNIEWLTRFDSINKLFLGKINNNLESIVNINTLKSLTLYGMQIESLAFLNDTQISELELNLIKCESLSDLKYNGKIKIFQIWKVDKLKDIDVIGYLPALETLRLIKLKGIKRIPYIVGSYNLKEILMDGLNDIEDISELDALENLESIIMYQAKSIDSKALIPIIESGIKSIKCFTGSKKKDAEIQNIIKSFVENKEDNGVD